MRIRSIYPVMLYTTGINGAIDTGD